MMRDKTNISRKAAFFDRDGTINIDKGYLFKKQDIIFIDETLSVMRELSAKGYLLFIVTNQSGIGRGYYTEEDLFELNQWMLDELRMREIQVEKIYYCPHHPDAKIPEYKKGCTCRKPRIGLFLEAAKEYNLDLNNCLVFGDKDSDLALGQYFNCRCFLLDEDGAFTEKK